MYCSNFVVSLWQAIVWMIEDSSYFVGCECREYSGWMVAKGCEIYMKLEWEFRVGSVCDLLDISICASLMYDVKILDL